MPIPNAAAQDVLLGRATASIDESQVSPTVIFDFKNMPTLTDEQIAKVKEWCAEGADLAGVQKRIDDEFEVRMTYLDTRMLLADLEVQAGSTEKEKAREAHAEKEAAAKAATEEVQNQLDAEAPAGDTPATDGAEQPGAPAASKVSVAIASVTPPGMIVAGTVTFSDGETAGWYLDQSGRLGMDPGKPDHKPTDEDLLAFQQELQSLLKKEGF